MPNRFLSFALLLLIALSFGMLAGVSANSVIYTWLYLLIFVLGSGACVVLGILHQRTAQLTDAQFLILSIGTGISLQLFFFIFSNWALQSDILSFLYPILALLFYLMRKPARGVSTEFISTPITFPFFILCLWVLGCSLTNSFLLVPLPERSLLQNLAYHQDIIWHLGNVAEASLHWPITDPHFSGEFFSYHIFFYFHLGAIVRVFGVNYTELYLILFQIYAALFFLLGVVAVADSVVVASEQRGLARFGSVLAVFCLGEIDLSISGIQGGGAFGEATIFSLIWSPTFYLSQILLCSIVTVLICFLKEPPGERLTPWTTLTILILLSAFGVKGSLIPVLFGGLVATLLLDCFLERRSGSQKGRKRQAAQLFICCYMFVGLLIAKQFLFANVGSNVLNVDFFGSVKALYFSSLILEMLPNSTVILFLCLPFIYLVILLGGLNVKLVGLLVAIKSAGNRSALLFLICSALAAFAITFSIRSAAEGQFFFLAIGYTLISILGGAFLLIGLQQNRRRPIFCFCVSLLLLLSAMDIPLDSIGQLREDRYQLSLHAHKRSQITSDDLRAREWIAECTKKDDVLATNNVSPLLLKYPALFGRRTFFGGWYAAIHTKPGTRFGDDNPFKERESLNRAVFQSGSRAALNQLVEKYGVDYLLIDKRFNHSSKALDLGNHCFESNSLVIVPTLLDKCDSNDRCQLGAI